MKRVIIAIFAVALMVGEANAFRGLGNQTVAALAEMHLTEKAKSEVRAILKSDMSRHALWLHSLKKRPELAHTQQWYFFTLDAQGKSTTTDANDGVVALERAIEVLRNRKNESDSLVLASLRTTIQLVGDMHCLSHVRIEGNKDSYGFNFKHWNNMEGKAKRVSNMKWYTMWEHTYLIRHDVFSPQFYATDVDIFLNAKKSEYENGTPRSWVENVGEDVLRCLEEIYPDVTIKTELLNRYEDIHNKALAKAGYRLAALLNDIFK